MPHSGHSPGCSAITCGCIGQVHRVAGFGREAGFAGSRAIPQWGQGAGVSLSTPGHMGQIHFPERWLPAASPGGFPAPCACFP
jgi:hypothetical protein